MGQLNCRDSCGRYPWVGKCGARLMHGWERPSCSHVKWGQLPRAFQKNWPSVRWDAAGALRALAPGHSDGVSWSYRIGCGPEEVMVTAASVWLVGRTPD